MASTIVISNRGYLVNGNNLCSFPECKMNVDVERTSGFSKSDQSPLNNIEKIVVIENNYNCSINTTSLFGLLNINTDQGLISFECLSDVWLQFYSDEMLPNKFTFSKIKISICRITLDSYYALKNNIGKIHTLTLKDTAISVQKNPCGVIYSSKSMCDVLASVTSFSLEGSTSKYAQHNLTFLFSCPRSYTSVKTLIIQGKSMDLRTISILEKKFPTLQSLEISNSNITIPPRFEVENVYSTRNISKDFKTAHANQENIVFDKRVTRALILKNNNIRDLRDFAFNGNLQILDLSCNGLQHIDDTTFTEIMGLERLNLRNNSLNKISSNLFKHLQNLQYLDLSFNNLTKISKEVFWGIKNLKYLDLSNNTIKTVDEKAFGELSHLIEINLRSNEIKHLPDNLFIAPSLKLKNIFIDMNPVENIPLSIFYIRSLEKASFRNTNIDLRDINEMLYRMDWQSLLNSVITSSPGIIDNLFFKTSEKLRIIDLSGSKIENFYLTPLGGYKESGSIVQMNKKRIVEQKLLLIVKYFEFILDGIKFTCDCRINEFNRIIHRAKVRGEFSGTEYIFQKLKCSTPSEMKNELVVNIKESDTYCQKIVPHCPYNCTCFERYISQVIIVDCRNRGYFSLPNRLPNGILDIWFQHNNVSVLKDVEYLNRTRYLSLSSNQIEEIKIEALNQITNLKHLFLNSNNLVTLPRELQKTNIDFIDINHNPFKCDCKSLWMKYWILNKSKYVLDIADVTCNVDTESEKGTKFINIPDVDFVCREDYDSMKDGIIPTTASTLAVLFSMIGICLLYVFRFEAKVLTFLYLGIHPFDMDEDDGREPVDVLVLHVPGLTQWVMDNIVTYLEKQKSQYVVCEIMRDFIPGFSLKENISCIVKNSKRLILVVSPEFLLEGQMLRLIWNEAQEKIKTLRHNYVVTVLHNVKIREITNKEVVRFVKNGNIIKWNDKLFCQKLLYCMPVYKGFGDIDAKKKKLPNIQNCVMNMYGDLTLRQEVYDRHVFISYSETEIHCMLNDIKPVLDEIGYSLWLPDRDFIPGASKEENILKAIDRCLHTLFFVSENHLLDEWSVFTFRTAFEKSLRSKSNHLIVILSENVDIDELDEEIKNLVSTHVILQIGEEWFVQKLLNSLSDAKPCIRCIVDETQIGEGFYIENDVQSVTDSMLFESSEDSDTDVINDNDAIVNNIDEINEDEEKQEVADNAQINIVVENNFKVPNDIGDARRCSINMSENEIMQNTREDNSSLSDEENSETDMSSDLDEIEDKNKNMVVVNQSGIHLNVSDDTTLLCGSALQMNIKNSLCLNVKEDEENLSDIQNVNISEVGLGSHGCTDIPYNGPLNCAINCQHYQITTPHNPSNGEAVSDSDNYADSENDDKEM